MSDLRQCSREFLLEFIELYRDLPCLWRLKSKDYNDKAKKGKAYEILVKKFKEVDPSATRDTVTRKINSIRSVYRKEMTKVRKSQQSGAPPDEVHKPTLWYYEKLSFLRDQGGTQESTSYDDCDSGKWEWYKSEDELSNHEDAPPILGLPSTLDMAEQERNSIPSPEDSCSSSATFSRSQSYPQKRKKRKMEKTTESSDHVLEKPQAMSEDAIDVFGKLVVFKLRGLENIQRILAQKLINDVIFEAEMEALTRDFKVADCGHPAPSYQMLPILADAT